MLRIHFTADDLLSTRFATAPAPLMELGLALAMTQRQDNDPGFARWRRSLAGAPVRSTLALRQLVPPTGAGPLFLDPLSEGLEEGLELVRRTPGPVVRAELTRVCDAGLAVTPWLRSLAAQDRDAWQYLETTMRGAFAALVGGSWPRIQAGFDADLAWRGRVLCEDGLRAMLAGLHQGARWLGTTLEFRTSRDRDLHLDGRGLVLLPSVCWTGRPMTGGDPSGAVLLVYPAITPLPYLDEPTPGDPLGPLLGRTRAAVLEQTVRGRTTTEIAAELGIGLATASEHAAALRRAGLISTLRTGRTVHHSCTALGHRLLTATAVR